MLGNHTRVSKKKHKHAPCHSVTKSDISPPLVMIVFIFYFFVMATTA